MKYFSPAGDRNSYIIAPEGQAPHGYTPEEPPEAPEGKRAVRKGDGWEIVPEPQESPE